MAHYKSDIVDVNLETGTIFRSFLNRSIGFKDDDADRFGIRAFRDGVPQDLSGASCQAIFMAPDGTKIALTSYGTVSGNKAYVTLPPACYDVEGQFTLAIKIVGGGVTSTVRIVDGVVANTGATGTVSPTSAVPTYQEVIAQYDAMVAATSAANTAIAETFDATKAYPAGKYVINDGALYILPEGHEANVTWANTTKTARKIANEMTTLKGAFDASLADYADTYITTVKNYENSGLTFNLTENGLQVYGTQTNSNRYYEGLNGRAQLRSTNTEFGKIIEPGLYRAYINIVEGTPSKTIQLTVSTTTGADAEHQQLNNGDVFAVTAESGVALRFLGATDFGTSSSPTVIDFGVVRLVACDEYARETAENALYNFGFYWHENILFENGSIDTSDGSGTTTRSNRLRSAFCQMKDGFKISVPSGWLFGCCLYSSAATSGYIKFTGWKNGNLTYMDMSGGAKYVRFVLKKTDDSDISPADASGVEISRFIKKDNITSYIPDLGIVQGSMNDHGGDSSGNYETRLRSGYVPVDSAFGFKMTVPEGFKVNYFLYTGNTSSTFFYESGAYTDDYTMHYGGADAANYVRFWIRKTDDSELTPADASGIVAEFYTSGVSAEDSFVLVPSGTDQTSEIQQLLDSGRCDLAPGTFYTTGVTMPDGAIFTGSGNKTKLVMTGSADGACITMGKYCTVKNMDIAGSGSEITPAATIGNRHGIYMAGSSSSISNETEWRCTISECTIHDFTGGGITLYRTGFSKACKIIGCYLIRNCVGLYIKEYSEYNHVSDCTMNSNYYGCINNGGNNLFSCCTFGSNAYGFMMGDTSGTDYGNSAKCEVGTCNFGHNTVRSIYINMMNSSGIGFNGCYISEAGAEIISSRSIIFSGCSFTDSFTLTVNGGHLILFNGCGFRNSFTGDAVSITNNNKVHFESCYYYDGTACDPVS